MILTSNSNIVNHRKTNKKHQWLRITSKSYNCAILWKLSRIHKTRKEIKDFLRHLLQSLNSNLIEELETKKKIQNLKGIIISLIRIKTKQLFRKIDRIQKTIRDEEAMRKALVHCIEILNAFDNLAIGTTQNYYFQSH